MSDNLSYFEIYYHVLKRVYFIDILNTDTMENYIHNPQLLDEYLSYSDAKKRQIVNDIKIGYDTF